jgi:acetyl esterase
MADRSVRFRIWFLSSVVTRLIKAPPIALTDRQVEPPESVWVKTRHGDVRCFITRPAIGAPLSSEGAAPVYVNFHGGAFLIGAPAQDDHLLRGVAGEVGAHVVNVDFTTAPKSQFPQAHEECLDVLDWVAHAGDEQGWDSTRIAIGGGSSGAHIALGVMELARETKGPRVRAAVLTCPLVDVTARGTDLVSRKAKPMVSDALMDTVRAGYFPVEATQATVLGSPLNGDREQFQHLPPLLVVAGELDALRPQIEDYVTKARGFGVPVTFKVIEGVDHDFPLSKETPAAIEELARLTRDHLLAHLA